jgi:hypothetical protein
MFDYLKGARFILLSGTAASALLCAAPAASARDSVVISVQGQLVIDASDGMTYGFENVAPNYPAQDLEDGLGAGGSAKFLYRFDSGWDIAAKFSMLGTGGDDSIDDGYGYSYYYTGFYGPTRIEGEVDTEVSMIDFEVGHDFGIGSGNLRVFGGVRLSWLERDITATTSYYDGGFYPRIDRQDTAWGIGPRLGLEASHPIGGGFGVFGGFSGAVLFGEKSTEQNGQFNGFPVTPEVDDTDASTTYAADAELGISYSFNFSTRTLGMLSLGYRADAWFSALDNDYPIDPTFGALYGASSDSDADYISHGPFLRLTVQF